MTINHIGKEQKIKYIVRMLFSFIFYYSGFFHIIRFWNNITGRRLTIVTYHRVTEKPIHDINMSLPYLFVTEKTFEKHMNFLKEHYRIISFNDLDKYAGGNSMPRNSLIITFDDGYEDNMTNAFPILLKHGIPWTIFLATGKIGKNEILWWDKIFAFFMNLVNKEEKEALVISEADVSEIFNNFKKNSSKLFAQLNTWGQLEIDELMESLKKYTNITDRVILSKNKFLDWEQVNIMGDNVEIGSHAYTHKILTGLESEQIKCEVIESKKMIEEKCSRHVTIFSYPAGQYSKDFESILSGAGYNYAVTQDKGVNDLRDPYTLKRVNLWEHSSGSLNGKFSRGYFAFKLLGL